MNAEQINARFLELTKFEEEQQKIITQATSNLAAVSGAKQDCQYWLSKVAEDAVSAENVVAAESEGFVPMQETAPEVVEGYEIVDPNPENHVGNESA